MQRYIRLTILWSGFVFGCICAQVIVLALPWLWHRSYPRNVGKALSRLMAALLGFDGQLMLSTELAFSGRFTWIRNSLHSIDPRHCEKSAIDEGAYCSLLDHRLGSK